MNIFDESGNFLAHALLLIRTWSSAWILPRFISCPATYEVMSLVKLAGLSF
ncbi:Uncharacterised protein [Vibrio cholerae]|nr:Uncharacterised protein [Vibrio cholerae]CSD44079.1 Uncharacterised protein [Vibrio cholerae]CSI47788.1 Uncharacterised protein [Vibrio cholerae]